MALYQAVAVENDIANGRRIMSALMPFIRTLEQDGKLIQFVKYACELQGLPAGTVRRSLRPLFKGEKRELEMVLRTLKHTMARITPDTQSPGNDLDQLSWIGEKTKPGSPKWVRFGRPPIGASTTNSPVRVTLPLPARTFANRLGVPT